MSERGDVESPYRSVHIYIMYIYSYRSVFREISILSSAVLNDNERADFASRSIARIRENSRRDIASPLRSGLRRPIASGARYLKQAATVAKYFAGLKRSAYDLLLPSVTSLCCRARVAFRSPDSQ